MNTTFRKQSCPRDKKTVPLSITYLLFFSFIFLSKVKAQNCTVNAGVLQQVCASTATLSGNTNGVTVGNPTWTFVSGPATPVIASPNTLSTPVTGMTVSGDYVFQIAQPCQFGGTATQTVTVTVYLEPVYTAGSGFVVCGSYNSFQNLSATLPPGWTGRWRAEDLISRVDVTSHFIFSNITSPASTVQLASGFQSCGNNSYTFVWEITSPNGVCKYNKSVNGKWNPDITQLDYELGPITRCGPGSVTFNLLPGSCGFTLSYHSDYSFTVVPVSVPAGFSGTLSAGVFSTSGLRVSGFTIPGTYTFNVNLISPCGTKSFGLFTVIILPPPPTTQTADGGKSFCIKSPLPSVSFNYTLADATIISTLQPIIRPAGSDPVVVNETGSGTTSRTITLIPNTGWKPGTYTINISLRNAADIAGTCTNTASFELYVYDSLGSSLVIPVSNNCLPTGSTSMSVTIPMPLNPAAYLGTNFNTLTSWVITKLSGPASGPNSLGSPARSATLFIPNLTAGQYKYKIESPAGNRLADEMACSNGPFIDSFIINVYNQAAANAGTNQIVLCINNLALAANIPASPSFGTWTVISAPVPVSFSNVNDPNARPVTSGTAPADNYTFRWTVADPNGACAVAFSNVTITSLTACAPLPVTILSFTAQKQGTAALLNWATATEQNTKEFVVEWSTNGQNWQAIGTVEAAGNSNSVLRYSFVHTSPVKGTNYYRLKQTDIDSHYKYTKVVAVKFDNSLTVAIMPNPVTNNLYINNMPAGSLVKLMAADGRVLLNRKVISENETVDMSHYAKGFYLLNVINEVTGAMSTFKLAKQ